MVVAITYRHSKVPLLLLTCLRRKAVKRTGVLFPMGINLKALSPVASFTTLTSLACKAPVSAPVSILAITPCIPRAGKLTFSTEPIVFFINLPPSAFWPYELNDQPLYRQYQP